jgi:cytoskeleton protein RodZ
MASTSRFGEHLKRERELRGVSIEEVSAATRISTKFLQAIEHGQWEQLPGGAFNRGFIRSASRYLGLDEESMVAEYSLETNGNGSSHAVARVQNELPRDWRPMAVLGGVVLVVIVALIAGSWLAVSKFKAHRRARAAIAAGVPASTSTNSGAAASAPANANRLLVTVKGSKAARLRVMADGRVLFEGKIEAGETKRFAAQDVVEISASDADAVQLELNGQPVPTMGSAGQPGRVTLTAKDVKASAGGVN